MAAVIRQRLGGATVLARLSDPGAWLADMQSHAISRSEQFAGDTRHANWLPDEAVARAWLAVVK